MENKTILSVPNTYFLKTIKKIKEYEKDELSKRIKVVTEILFMEQETKEKIKDYEWEYMHLINLRNTAEQDIKEIQRVIDIKLESDIEEEEEIEKKYVI